MEERLRDLDLRQLELVKELVRVMAEKQKLLDAQSKVIEITKARAAGPAREETC